MLALIEKAKQGDGEAYEKVFKNVEGEAISFIISKGLKPNDEVTQLCHLACFDAIKGYDPSKAKFTTYYYWKLTKHISKYKKELYESSVNEKAKAKGKQKELYEINKDAEKKDMLYAILDSSELSERDKEIILGRVGRNETLQTLSDKYQITREGVRQLVHRSMLKLQKTAALLI